MALCSCFTLISVNIETIVDIYFLKEHKKDLTRLEGFGEKSITNLLEAIENKDYGFILVNFANPDMVGHTGDIPAATKACKVVDECVGKIADKCKEYGITMLLTAYHVNA